MEGEFDKELTDGAFVKHPLEGAFVKEIQLTDLEAVSGLPPTVLDKVPVGRDDEQALADRGVVPLLAAAYQVFMLPRVSLQPGSADNPVNPVTRARWLYYTTLVLGMGVVGTAKAVAEATYVKSLFEPGKATVFERYFCVMCIATSYFALLYTSIRLSFVWLQYKLFDVQFPLLGAVRTYRNSHYSRTGNGAWADACEWLYDSCSDLLHLSRPRLVKLAALALAELGQIIVILKLRTTGHSAPYAVATIFIATCFAVPKIAHEVGGLVAVSSGIRTKDSLFRAAWEPKTASAAADRWWWSNWFFAWNIILFAALQGLAINYAVYALSHYDD